MEVVNKTTQQNYIINNPQVVLDWKAPLRPYKKKSGLILRFYVAVALLLSVIIWFFGDNILLIPTWVVLFLFYVLTITPPPDVENKITKFGIETAGVMIRWESLSYFFFKNKFGFDVLTLVGHPPYNYHAYLVIPTKEIKERVMQILSKHIVFKEKPHEGLTDKLVKILSSLVPDEDSNQKEDSVSNRPKVSVATP